MNSIWTILGIGQTSDLRQIKRAYSKQLKLNKPDEKPEAFQQLHQAYKAAMNEARRLSEQENIEAEEQKPESGLEIDENAGSGLEMRLESPARLEYSEPYQYQPVDPELTYHYQGKRIFSEKAGYKREIERILVKVDAIISGLRGHEQNAWHFILESEYILLQAFVDELGLSMLRRLASYFNEEEYRGHGDFAIDADILFYLNGIFRWDLYEYDFSYYLVNKHGLCQFNKLQDFDEKTKLIERDVTTELRGAKSIKKVFKMGVAPFKNYYYGSNEKRFFAMLLDLGLAAAVISLITLFSEVAFDYQLTQEEGFTEYALGSLYFVGTWLFESSSYQSTPGKKVLGLTVINLNQGGLSYWHGLFRTAVYALTCFVFLHYIFHK